MPRVRTRSESPQKSWKMLWSPASLAKFTIDFNKISGLKYQLGFKDRKMCAMNALIQCHAMDKVNLVH